MNPEIKDKLLQFDEPGRYETPSKFDHGELKKRVITLVKDLNDNFRVTFSIDDRIEDASFYCDINIPPELIINPKPLGYSIRISNFGGLATINFQNEYSDETNLLIEEILERHDFAFISADDLDQEYDGQFEEFKNILGGESPTWQIRYFDYL